MNKNNFIGIILVSALSACSSSGSSDSSAQVDELTLIDTDPSVLGSDMFPNGIWEAVKQTTYRDDFDTFDAPFRGGMLITLKDMKSTATFPFNGDGAGDDACFHASESVFVSWPNTVMGFPAWYMSYEGSFEDGMVQTQGDNGATEDVTTYTYVGPVTAESAAAFDVQYGNICDHPQH